MDKHILTTEPFKTSRFSRREFIRLDLNENSSVLKPIILKSISRFSEFDIGAYPDYQDFTKSLAHDLGVNESNICIFNGADAGIVALLRLFASSGDYVIMPIPTFGLYQVAVSMMGINAVTIPYTLENNKSFTFPIEKILSKLKGNTRALLLCNPNNPLGTSINNQDLNLLIKKCYELNIPIIIDEAYIEFSGSSALKFITKYPNVIIIRTFSKYYGLAGLRLGLIISRPSIATELRKLRLPWGVSGFSVHAAKVILKHKKHFNSEASKLIKRKELLIKSLKTNGIRAFASDTNFVLGYTTKPNKLVRELKKKKILISNMSHHQPSSIMKNMIRITIPSEADFSKTVEAITIAMN